MQVYHSDEVERFAKVFFLPSHQKQAKNHPLLTKELQPAVGRFRQLSEDDQEKFRDRLGAYVRLYVFMSQIISYADSDLEQLAAFARKLLPNLGDGLDDQIRLEGDVELEFYRLQRVSSGAIELGDGETVKSPHRGRHRPLRRR